MSVFDVEPSFVGLNKKKRKQVNPDFVENKNGARDEDGSENQPGDDEEDGNIPRENAQYPWEGTARDYHYKELLGRVFNFLHENNPDLAGDRRRTIISPPHVLGEGTKKTVFTNFMYLCRMMHKHPEHVQIFLLTELGTRGNLDGRQRLIVKGRFVAKKIASIL